MPPGLPHQPLAMRLWLSRRSGRGSGADSAGSSSGRSMSIGSLEHLMRNRFRMFLRHTWLVTVFGTIVFGGVVWAVLLLDQEHRDADCHRTRRRENRAGARQNIGEESRP